jgi:UDP-N-acetylmuramoyl-L-alanyl-D-glutamate--2,6-diaminopimelate ligase
MKWDEIIEQVQVEAVTGTPEHDIKGITCDSRHVRDGYIFVALRGLREDGNRYIKEAVRRGASVVITEDAPPQGLPVCHVRVTDGRQAMAEMAAALYDHPARHLQVVGVTGTNGKTTVTFMCRSILREAGRTPGLVGTVQYEIGERVIPAGRTTPEAPELHGMMDQMRTAGCRSVAMEVSSHALDQRRVYGIDFDVGVFTNLTQEHLDYHRTMEDYFEAKSILFSSLGQASKKAAAVINIDDPYGARLARMRDPRVQVITYGLNPGADVCAENIQMGETGSEFTVRTPWGGVDIKLPLPGRFNISNALAALAACGALGVDPEETEDVLAEFTTVPGRLERIPNRHGVKVCVDYAHTPDALHNVLATIREITEQRIICVFGCGGDRDRSKRMRMGTVAAQMADHSVVTTDNPRSEDPGLIAREIAQGFGASSHYEIVLDRREAMARALAMAQPGDWVLVAGKGHENYQEFANTVVVFDDREVLRTLLK